MPRDKDFKRLVRARMEKTGESYTTARLRLMEKGGARSSEDAATPAPRGGPTGARDPALAAVTPGRRTAPSRAVDPAPADRARRAGMSDVAVERRTGRTWAGWLDVLDAADRPHREIARLLHDEHGLTAWWAQTVTVGYERLRGLREVGQRRAGSYDANKSRTFGVPVDVLYRAFAHRRVRQRWLPDERFTVRTATRPRSMRIGWHDGSTVALWFTVKGPDKATVQIQQGPLADREAVAASKAFWAERLDALAAVLAPSAG